MSDHAAKIREELRTTSRIERDDGVVWLLGASAVGRITSHADTLERQRDQYHAEIEAYRSDLDDAHDELEQANRRHLIANATLARHGLPRVGTEEITDADLHAFLDREERVSKLSEAIEGICERMLTAARRVSDQERRKEQEGSDAQ